MVALRVGRLVLIPGPHAVRLTWRLRRLERREQPEEHPVEHRSFAGVHRRERAVLAFGGTLPKVLSPATGDC
ncbi:hypothetical protein [Agromyces sp. GXS1127]|uniref:hypothetical protein n=1 Tax=Agromyces sp. GXS1127 TaxID=3424181 RepID=UPI003D31E06F